MNEESRSMNNDELNQHLIEQSEELLRIKQLNLDLMDSMESTILFLMAESEKNNTKIPNINILDSLMKRVLDLYSTVYQSNSNHDQPSGNTDKSNLRGNRT